MRVLANSDFNFFNSQKLKSWSQFQLSRSRDLYRIPRILREFPYLKSQNRFHFSLKALLILTDIQHEIEIAAHNYFFALKINGQRIKSFWSALMSQIIKCPEGSKKTL